MSVLSRSKLISVPSLAGSSAARSSSALIYRPPNVAPFQTPLRSGCPSAVRGVAWAEARSGPSHATAASTAIAPACLFTIWIARPDREHAAIGKLHVLDQPEIRAILGQHAIHRDGVTYFHPAPIGPAEPRPAQRARTRHFEGPALHFAAVVL